MIKPRLFLPVLLLAGHVAEAALNLRDDHSVEVTVNGHAAVFTADFVVLLRDDDPKVAMRPSGLKDVTYNTPTWLADDNAVADYQAVRRSEATGGDGLDDSILDGDAGGRTANVFFSGTAVPVRASASRRRGDTIAWEFPADPRFTLAATLSQPGDDAPPVLEFTLTPRADAYFSVGYKGAPSAAEADVAEGWQPLVWTERRLPARPFLTAAYMCPLPAALLHSGGLTTGVIADPVELPFQPLPTFDNSRFGVALRDLDGSFRGMVFAPMMGGPGSRRAAGETFSFKTRLVVSGRAITGEFERLARDLYGFADHRSNAIGSLNTTLDNMLAYGLSDWSWFELALKGCAYSTDVPGAVKNVSSLNPINLAIVADEPRAFSERGYPIAEFMVSREKTLFTLDPHQKIQSPSRNMLGPCAPISELAALHGVTGGPALLELAGQIVDLGRKAGSRSADWRQWLALWENTGDQAHLDRAVREADAYLQRRYETPSASFRDRDAGSLFFWTSHAPHWIELVRLHEATGERRYLAAAREGARRFAMYIWMCPRIPDTDVTVNEGGLAPMYWYLDRKGHQRMRAPEETVPAWRLSEIGLTSESSGTAAGHRAIFMANHAPWMLRIAALTGDGFLHDIARSAVIGRYLNFPGYHINTARTTVYEKADYPLRPHKELSANSFHYNHIWPHMSILLDYLTTDAEARSGGRVKFPSRFIEGYAYLKSRFVGDRPGVFYSLEDAWLWMPRGLVQTGSVELNHVSARTDDALALLFMNESDAPVKTTASIDTARVLGLAGETLTAQHWIDNAEAAGLTVTDGRLALDVPARGIVAVIIRGVRPQVGVQRELVAATRSPAWTTDYAEGHLGGLRAMSFNFGPGRRTLYTYLREDDSTVKSAALEVIIDGRTETFLDDAYPYEWTQTLPDDAKAASVKVTVTRLDGREETGRPVALRR
ncbi:MAG: hypothetical protein ABII82_07030 [Verrucomicrobiota bacterium]